MFMFNSSTIRYLINLMIIKKLKNPFYLTIYWYLPVNLKNKTLS